MHRFRTPRRTLVALHEPLLSAWGLNAKKKIFHTKLLDIIAVCKTPCEEEAVICSEPYEVLLRNKELTRKGKESEHHDAQHYAVPTKHFKTVLANVAH